MTNQQPGPLMTQRAALIFLFSAVIATVAGVLAARVDGGTALTGLLLGGATFGAAVGFLHGIID
ncbi:MULTISPECIES: hypothetical protein [unclassified Streptomyces]|uniref:hypothetical protein n=1 Tax=unclassified Streptomyces TaxID=2593676 RepID=UPI002E2BB4B8|nr:hypothetical protein [Streptomyces sp. NBC_00273]